MHVLHQGNTVLAAKISSVKTALSELGVTNSKKIFSLFWNAQSLCIRARRSLKNIAGTDVKSDADATDINIKLQSQSKSILSLLYDTRRDIERALPDFNFLTKPTLRGFSKVTWSNGSASYSCILSRMSSPHSRTH